jgi:hypothetical protein
MCGQEGITASTVTSHLLEYHMTAARLVAIHQQAINIRRNVARAYCRAFIEPLHGNDHVLLACT